MNNLARCLIWGGTPFVCDVYTSYVCCVNVLSNFKRPWWLPRIFLLCELKRNIVRYERAHRDHIGFGRTVPGATNERTTIKQRTNDAGAHDGIPQCCAC